MKKALTLLSACIAFLAFSSFSAITPEGLVVKVKKGNISVQGTKVVPGWSLNTFKTALGEPDRSRDGYNNTYTYDNLSVVLFEKKSDKKGTGIVNEFQLHYKVSDPNDVTPNGNGFKGSLKIDKLVVTSSLTPELMQSKLKAWKKTDSYIEHSYRMSNGPLYIYFQFNENETGLEKVSIGPNTKK